MVISSLLRRQEPSGVCCVLLSRVKRLPFVDASRVSARRPRYFLLLRQNKVSKEKATEASPPLRGPLCCKSKNRKVRKLASLAGRTIACKRLPLRRRSACTSKPLLHLKHRPFYFHFLPCSKGIDTSERRKSKTATESKTTPKSTATSMRPLGILLL